MARETRERSFDALTRGLASGDMSRRRALRLMGAALVGSTLASLGIGEAAADPPDPRGCKRSGKRCKNDTQCCSGNCDSGTCASCRSIGGSCTADLECCSDSFNCSGGTCAPCVSVGGSCTADIQCCADESTNFLRICDIPAGQSSGTCATCRANGNPCDTSGECCSGDCLFATNTCATPCLPNCSPCDTSGECCGGNCDGGICEPLAC